MLELLEIEIGICMGLLGVTSFEQLNPRYLQAAQAPGAANVLSAFPLLSLDDKSFY
jgi:glycolate oxidase